MLGLLTAAPLRAADPTPIACPSGQTVLIQGTAPAREPLLLYLAGRPVGGGVADARGAYSLPLRAQERPGVYPVEVRLRTSRAVVARFTCFVDLPVGDVPASATPLAPSTPVAPPTLRSGPPAATPSATSTRTSGIATPTATTRSTATGGTPTLTTTRTVGPGPTASATNQPGVATVTPSATTTAASTVQIVDIVLIDPAYPDDTEEYVQIRNASDATVNIGGWRLLNASRSDVAPFVFPAFALEADVTIAVFSETGENDLEIGDFFWNQSQAVWRVGDRAELRDAGGQLIHSLVVPDQ
ncbi:MAG: lamin tail domain-containing protein [Chloroflexi bacterium OHK40]